MELDVGGRRDQLEPELPLEPFLDDVHVEQAEEPAPEPEPERPRGLGLVDERRVVQLQPVERLPQLRVVAALGGEQAAPHHRPRLAVARQGLVRALLAGERDGVADLDLVDVLQAGHEVADLSRLEPRHGGGLRREDPGLLGLRVDRARHEPHLRARRQQALLHAEVGDHAAVRVERRVEDQRAERPVAFAGRGRDATHDLLDQLGHALPGLGADGEDVLGRAPHDLGELAPGLVDVGLREVDLVQHRHDDQPGVPGEVEVRERLGLDPLRGVDEEHGPLARGQRARDLVREVDVAGGVDQVELVVDALEPVRETHGLRLDRDPALALEIHLVEVLLAHVAVGDGVRELEQAIGQRRLAVVDVRDDAEVPDVAVVRSPRSRRAYRTGAARGDTLGRAWGRWYTRPSMANIKSQIKRNRQNEKRRKRNQGVRSSLKTATKKATTAAASGDAETAAAVREASRAYDKAASKGILHKRAAARHKSRLAKAANRAAASAE